MGTHLTITELEEGLARAGESPADNGTLEMIVNRPGVAERLINEQAELDAGVVYLPASFNQEL
jgi:hypothetical protein